jgi:CRISPR-associated protein Csb2
VIGLQIRFLAGRFHANGWYHAHNEGVPEWPPSPWRVLRALVSAACAEEIPAGELESLLEKLRELPRYRLPLAVDAHTRHYMPGTDANASKSKVFDAFVAVEGGAKTPQPLTMAWPVELSPNEHLLLERLVGRISYLGRAESWADIRVVKVDGNNWDCWPDEHEKAAGATALLALSTSEQLAAWAQSQTAPRKGRDVPRSIWDVLTFDGARYRNEGWSSVPGTQLFRYVFQSDPFRRSTIPRSNVKNGLRPTIARFAIRSAVLPRVHDALAIAERLRTSAMSQSRRVSGEAQAVFSGHVEGQSNHQHAMYLATSEAKRGVIDHLTIAARSGFDEQDIIALQRLRQLWGSSGHDLELVLIGLGTPEDYGGFKAPRARALAESRVWESATPFIPTRHTKFVRGIEVDTIEDQLIRACVQLVGARPIQVSPIGNRAEWARFRRRRFVGAGSRGPDRAFGARLVFQRPVRGPIALGYGAHFGLGLFCAVEEDTDG